MQLQELFQPAPDETSGQTMFKGPIRATGATDNKQVQFPKGTVVTLSKKLPQKQLVLFTMNGKQYFTTEADWQRAVGL